MRPPHQALDQHPAARGGGEQLPDGGAAGAEQLPGVAAPVGEEEVVARAQRLDLVHQPREVLGAVHERPDEVAVGPGGLVGRRVAALLGAEEPVLRGHRRTLGCWMVSTPVVARSRSR